MKNSYKIALLAALGLASISAKADYTSGDLLVGVYQPGVSQTTYVDIGQFSGLTQGETWDLTTALTAAGLQNLTSTAEFGVVGVSGSTLWATGVGQTLSKGSYNNVATAVMSIGNNPAIESTGTSYSWDTQTFNDPPASGTLIGGGMNVDAALGNQDTLYTDISGTSVGRPPVLTDGTFTQDSFFTLTSNGGDDVLTYGAVPEPSTYGLLAGAGLLFITLRNKPSRKIA